MAHQLKQWLEKHYIDPITIKPDHIDRYVTAWTWSIITETITECGQVPTPDEVKKNLFDSIREFINKCERELNVEILNYGTSVKKDS